MIYRGYEIFGNKTDGYTWVNEHGVVQYADVTGKRFKTDEAAMDDIDRHRRQLARTRAALS